MRFDARVAFSKLTCDSSRDLDNHDHILRTFVAVCVIARLLEEDDSFHPPLVAGVKKTREPQTGMAVESGTGKSFTTQGTCDLDKPSDPVGYWFGKLRPGLMENVC